MTFFSTETVAFLSSLVGLRQQIQGMINRETGAVSHFTTDSSDFDSLIKRMRYDTLCVQNMRILHLNDVLSGSSGTEVLGTFQVQGNFVKGTTGIDDNLEVMLGAGQIVKGHEFVPPELKTVDGVYLLLLPASEAYTCLNADLIPFGSQNARKPLVPTARYVRSLCDHSIKKAVLACSNGLYVLSVDDGAAFLARSDVYDNLVNLQYVCTLRPAERGRSAYAEGASTLYRISANAVVVGRKTDAAMIEEVQRVLNTNADARNYLQTSSHFSITRGVVDFQARSITFAKVEEALRTVCGDGVKVRNEPLVKWQRPAQVLKLAVSITEIAPPADALAQFYTVASTVTRDTSDISSAFSEHFLALNGQLGVIVSVSSAKTRSPLPGETSTAPTNQLRRVVLEAVRRAIGGLSGGATRTRGPPEESMDQSFTQSLGDAMRDQLQDSGLYKELVKVTIESKTSHYTGKEIHLPDGMSTLIPEYARYPQSARIAVALEALSHLGVQVRFTSWDAASVNGVRSD